MPVDQDAFGPTSAGLDRGTLHVYTNVGNELKHEQYESYPKEISEQIEVTPESRSPVAGIRRLSRRIGSKFHKHRNEASVPWNDQGLSKSRVVAPTLAPAPPDTTEKDRFSEAVPDKPTLPPLKDIVRSPLQTAKTVMHEMGGGDVAENLAKTDATHEASVKVVRAHDKLAETTTDDDEKLALQELELMKKARQDAYVRWTLDRHIKKVGALQPPQGRLKPRKDFLVTNEHGRQVMQWKDYGNHLLIFYLEHYCGTYINASSAVPEPTQDALMAAAERVILTSAPLQDLFMWLRKIAQWEQPSESLACMTAYFLLCYYDYILRIVLVSTFFLVLKRHFYPRTIDSMRESLERTEDIEATPTNLTQHIDQHGGQGWVDPLIQKAGPTVLALVENLADSLEILRNFYEWRDPRRTAFTLGIIATFWLLITFVPLWLLVRAWFFGNGIMFFGLSPLSYRYPRYRQLLNPLIWMFWQIPTHSEWAIARLQAEATQRLEISRHREHGSADDSGNDEKKSSSSPNPSASSASPISIGRYHCIFEKRHGTLCLNTEQVSFKKTLYKSEKWSMRYDHMHSMQKKVGTDTMKKGDDIIFTDMDGREIQVSGLQERDEVFSQIIGYSNVRWQRTG